MSPCGIAGAAADLSSGMSVISASVRKQERGDRCRVLKRRALDVLRRLRDLLQLLGHGAHSGLDAALEPHRVGARRDVPEPFPIDRLREHDRGGRAVARDVGGLRGDLLQHLRAHVLVRILELDLLGDRHAVLGDRGAPEPLIDDDVPALRAQRRRDRRGHDVDAPEQARPGLFFELQLLRHRSRPPYSRMARTSSSRRIRYSLSSSFTSEPEYFPKRILSPALTSSGIFLPSSVTLPLPTAMTLPSWGFSLAVSGMMIPPFLISFSSSRSTRRRSCNGRIFIGQVPPSDFGIRRAPFIMALDAPKRLPIDSDEHDGLIPCGSVHPD